MRSIRVLKSLHNKLDIFITGKLWLKVIIALILGVTTGILLGPDMGLVSTNISSLAGVWLALPGQIFLGLIQMIVVPLVLTSVVKGIASNRSVDSLKKVGLIAIIFIAITTAIAAAVGIGLTTQVKPGHYVDVSNIEIQAPSPSISKQENQLPSLDQLPTKMMSILPKNPMASMVTGEMLQVIFFAVVLGLALVSIPEDRAKPLIDFLSAIQEVTMKIVSWAMHLAPLAVFGLMAKLVANVGFEVLAGMLIYVLCVLSGLIILSGIYLVALHFLSNVSVSNFLKSTKELLLLAFSTSSSAAVMPTSMTVAENDLKVRPDISKFIIPLGATINMTGTALYQGVATVFLAQVFSIDLSTVDYIFIVTMATTAAIGSPATPGAGIVILSTILEGVGIPAAGIAIILGVDRILDMSRTTLNVLGDVALCCILNKRTF